MTALSVRGHYNSHRNTDVSTISRDDRSLLKYISINIEDMDSAIDNILACIRAGEGFCFYTVNLDHLVKLHSDAAFGAAYRQADFVSADGWPVVWLLRRQGDIVRRTTGADLVEPLCASAAEDGVRVYFVGPGPEPQRDALALLQTWSPNLIVAGAESPTLTRAFSDVEADALADRLRGCRAQLCFLSLGAPKQELIAQALRRRCPEVGFVCVGAALDFISGHAVRAPRLVRAVGLEWLWRVATNPRRLGWRYVQCLAWFAVAGLRSFAHRPPSIVLAAADVRSLRMTNAKSLNETSPPARRRA